VVWQNNNELTKGKTQKKKHPSRRKSPVKTNKHPKTKRKSTAGFNNQSRGGTTKDLSERRRQARERQKRARKADNVINFPQQHRPSQPGTGYSPPSGMERSILLIVRFVILAVGIGAIAGTILYFLDRDKYLAYPGATPTEVTSPATETTQSPPPPVLPLKQEVPSLKQTFQTLASQQPQLNPAAFIVDLDSGKYVNLQGETAFPAASMIKVPILIAFFKAWDEGQLRLDEPLTITEEVKAGGSGNMQYEPVGTQYLALETAAKMIIISDNTATNMMIKRLGGKDALNQLFNQWGLEQTRIRNPLPDVEGTNTTSPKELVELLAKLNNGKLVSARSRDQIFRIMRETRRDNLLPQGLGKGATIAHKTGHIGSLVGDVGMIDQPSGKRYLAAIMVERPDNNSQANQLIRRYSQETYQYFQKQDKNSFITEE